ncbi:MAG: CotH kinase family protein [Bacteroidota bacterium]
MTIQDTLFTKARISILFSLSLLLATQLSAQILTSTNLPIIVVNTDDEEIPDEPKIDGTMSIIFNGEGITNNVNDPFNYYDGRIGIETRGNSTQGFDKKTYSLELRDADNEDLSVNLFGMGAEEDWILHAMVIDKSQLRIPMSFYFFQQMGHYAAKWRYVELIVNDEYRGLYILTERIKRDDDRVDIAKLDEDDLSGDAVTGGYILRIDWLEDFDDDDGFESAYDSQGGIPMTFQWYYPKADNIQAEQAQYIENWMNDFEDAVFSPDYTNEQGLRYSDYINLNSFVDFLLINEFTKNSDGYKLSSYIHKDRDSDGGKLAAGPIWDFDQTYGVSTVCSSNDFTGWTYLQNQDGCEDLESMPMWWQSMMQDTLFQNRLQCRWIQFRNSFLRADNINSWIDTHVDLIAGAIDRNFTLWDDFIGEPIWIEPEPIPQSYPEEIQVLKSWITNRLNWMDNNLPGNCTDIVSTSDINSLNTISVYPNPGHSLITIESNITSPVDFELYSLVGIRIMEGTINSNRHEVDISQLPDNVYLLRVGEQVLKVVKTQE